MGVWPLVLVAIFAGFIGLLELDWSQIFPDPAREALQDVWTEVQGWGDVDARLRIWGVGTEAVRLRIQAIPQEGALRVELLEPEGLKGQLFTYRKGMLVHYRPGNGGLRIVYELGEGEVPQLAGFPQELRVTLEASDPLGVGWEERSSPSLTLPGLAGTSPGSSGLAASPAFWSPGFKRLRITGFPAPIDEVEIWLDDEGKIRGGSVTWGNARITIQVEELLPNRGLTLLELLQLPRAKKTLWLTGDQSM